MAVMACFTLLTYTAVYASSEHHAHEDKHEGHGDGHHDEHEEEAKGPNKGRLLVDGDFALELVLFERGVEPEYRVYATNHHDKLAPTQVNLTLTLTRLGGIKDKFTFKPEGDYLKGDLVKTSKARRIIKRFNKAEISDNYFMPKHYYDFIHYGKQNSIAVRGRHFTYKGLVHKKKFLGI